jgi:PPOX class probable F420-dependent enzyme
VLTPLIVAVWAGERRAGQAGGVEEAPQWVTAALRDARVARLGTVDGTGAVRLVPVCLAVNDGWIVGAVDHKPKRTGQLRRLDDMHAAGSATVLVDHYAEDWAQLWWVRVRGRAEVLTSGDVRAAAIDALVGKYEQYRQRRPDGAVWRIAADEVRWWRASG